MGIREMTDVGPELTRRDIETLERKLPASLPASYKSFLLRHNGGRPEPPFFKSNVLAEFFSVHAEEKLYDLLANCRRMKKWLPTEVIPVARDEFGNKICLAIKGKNRGKVYFWDHEGAPEPSDIRAKYPEFFLDLEDEPEPPRPPTWPGYPDLTLIADSFDEFLQSFHEDEDDEEQPESPEDPDLVLVDIDPDQFLPGIDEDGDDDEPEEPGKRARKPTAPKTRKQPARSSSKKRTSKTTRPRKKRTSKTTSPRKKR